MIRRKNAPEDVFTPRSTTVNPEMYIHREELEASLIRALRKPKHIIIHGESGCGKTWLYKEVLNRRKIRYEVLNAATVNSSNGFFDAIRLMSARLKPLDKKGYDQKKSTEVSALVAKGNLEQTNNFEYKTQEPYLDLLKILFSKAEGRDSFLVIDNLEHIVRNDKLVEELSSLLLYLDDEEYGKNKVKIILVGTPNNIREYFNTTQGYQTIVNRVQEIPEVSLLNNSSVSELAHKGFFELLDMKIEKKPNKNFDKTYLLNAIAWFSAKVPQYVHDFCLQIAFESEENNTITYESYNKALHNWLKESLISESAALEANINSTGTKVGRRNQVILAISRLNFNEFNSSEVEKELRELFPDSTKGKQLNISAIMSELANNKHPIIRKTLQTGNYRFIDPKLKIIARWMLKKLANETIQIKKFDESIQL